MTHSIWVRGEQEKAQESALQKPVELDWNSIAEKKTYCYPTLNKLKRMVSSVVAVPMLGTLSC